MLHAMSSVHSHIGAISSRCATSCADACEDRRIMSMAQALHHDARVRAIVETPVLLVACDFDGTLAQITDSPDAARIEPAAAEALQSLLALPHTHVAIVSGRGLGDLRQRVGTLHGVRYVGSHGAESDGEAGTRSADVRSSDRASLIATVRRIASGDDGLVVEEKPLGVALHYRRSFSRDGERATAAVEAIRERLRQELAAIPALTERLGHCLVEWSVVSVTKGDAVASLRQRVGATSVLFIGDDVTDEDALRSLGPQDLGIRVGGGPTAASMRLENPAATATWLSTLAKARGDWLRAAHAVPIERHTLLSDQRTVALLTPEARIVWCCLPRIDSPALFAELLGGPMAGRFAITPLEGGTPTQRYVGPSFLCETRWPTMRVTDCLDCSAGRPFLRAGRSDLLRVIEGSGTVRIDFAPRLDFGRQATRLRVVPEGLFVEGTHDPVVLRSPGVEWTLAEEGPHQRAEATVTLGETPLILELRYGLSTTRELVAAPLARLEQTRRFWELWASPLRLPTAHRELVLRSALVLKALCYGPTGAIAAAATTSLPEGIGGVRNWDYRFCWLRDAALSATALAKLGSPGIGAKLLDWMLGILDRTEEHEGGPERFRPVYSVTGGELGAEAEISELIGYRGSRPVRVGNAAAQQLQLDVFGPILELVATLAASGMPLSAEHWRLTEAVVRAVELRWVEPDHGIWEVRGPLRHHLHSKVMCWMAVDRAIAIAAAFASEPPAAWHVLRAAIGADVLERGWSADAGAYTAAYGETTIDAASLSIGLSGLLPCTDARFRSTIAAVERDLRVGPTVFRYRFDDGLPGAEGGFQLCTAWLIEALARSGERERARALLDRFATSFGPTGLAAEEFDPATEEWLGNHPQAYTHLGLIEAVLACEEADRGAGSSG